MWLSALVISRCFKSKILKCLEASFVSGPKYVFSLNFHHFVPQRLLVCHTELFRDVPSDLHLKVPWARNGLEQGLCFHFALW